MDVSVGSFSDPEGLEGLAHFLGEFDCNACYLLDYLVSISIELISDVDRECHGTCHVV